MIRPDTGSRWKVSGNSIAMVAIGPMPGSTPISVPISAPTSAKPRFAGVIATPKPVARWSSSSITTAGQTGIVNPSPSTKIAQASTMSTSAAASASHDLDVACRECADADEDQDR